MTAFWAATELLLSTLRAVAVRWSNPMTSGHRHPVPFRAVLVTDAGPG